FFQAEDGIRDGHVTGVQTCALPISGPVCKPLMPFEAAYALRRGESNTLEQSPSIKLKQSGGARVILRLEQTVWGAALGHRQFAAVPLLLPDAAPSGYAHSKPAFHNRRGGKAHPRSWSPALPPRGPGGLRP